MEHNPVKVALVDLDGQTVPDWVAPHLQREGVELIIRQCNTQDELAAYAKDAEIIWLFGGSRVLHGGSLSALPRCWGIVRTGSGTDNVPVEEATGRGIVVANTPAALSDGVSDHVIALLMALVRRLPRLDREVRSGVFDQRMGRPLNSFRGRTFGLVGFGHIAREVFRKLSGFGMNWLVHDPFIRSEDLAGQRIQLVTLDILLSESDFVSIHCPLAPATRGLIGESELRRMKPSAILINTSRGPVVDETALVRALTDGSIAAAGLDVFEKEPPAADNPLLQLENVILTPHSASLSGDGMEPRWRSSVEAVLALARRQWPPSCVNRDVKPAQKLTAPALAAAAVSLGVQRQMEIYQQGQRKMASSPLSADEWEELARQALPQPAYTYVAGGAGREDTVRSNREAFRRWQIVPRFLRDVSRRDLSVSILGKKLPAPVFMAPIGVQEMLHAEAELAVARAAKSLGVPLVLSNVSSTPLESVAETMGDVPHWFQLYWPRDPALAASFLHRAEAAGFSALVVTLDTYLLGWRERDLRLGWLPFMEGKGMANYLSDPVFRAALSTPPEQNLQPAVERFFQVVSNAALTWNDLEFLRNNTRLPILLKGILHADDARKAVEYGVEGVIVSNHGGRQVDGELGALDALPGVVAAVAGRAAVLFDSGIRCGADVFKAMALGAQAILLGRPYCYGLAVAGETGVRDVLRNLLADIELTLGLAGCTSFAEVGRGNVVETANS